MVKWLKGLTDREESTVNEVQVVDFLTGKGVSKEEAMEVRPIICVIPAVT